MRHPVGSGIGALEEGGADCIDVEEGGSDEIYDEEELRITIVESVVMDRRSLRWRHSEGRRGGGGVRVAAARHSTVGHWGHSGMD
jgi:hypothetical protein